MENITALIRLEGIRKKFFSPGSESDLEVLKGVDLSIRRGETTAILGPSGCGKSTLLNIMGGLDSPSEGSITFGDKNLNKLSSVELARFRNQSIGFLFQSHHLLPQCSVIENVLIPCLAFQSSPKKETIEYANKLLVDIGLKERINHRPSQLSGGERQRVAFVRSLIQKPEVILADEPTGSLDPETANRMADLLIDINQKEQLTLIAVTHSMELAGRMKRVLRFSDGKLVESAL